MSHSKWDNRHWVIMDWPQPAEAWAAVLEREETCRKSLDGTQVLMKWNGDTPAYFANETIYGHDVILTILAGTDWSEPMPEPE